MEIILERIFEVHLQRHITKNNIIQPQQFRFRAKHSTTQQLVRVTEDINKAFELGGKTDIFLGIEKAFDKLWIRGLLLKCKEKKKLPIWMTLFIASFLTNRKFTAKLNQANSEIKHIYAGVPQGNVLGHILFNIYVGP